MARRSGTSPKEANPEVVLRRHNLRLPGAGQRETPATKDKRTQSSWRPTQISRSCEDCRGCRFADNLTSAAVSTARRSVHAVRWGVLCPERMVDLVSRSWNGTPISRRPADGYVNATAMCKANGKQWNDFWRTDRCTSYLEALEAITGFPVLGQNGLVHSVQGGSTPGTWVHPDVATELARWISAEFSVFVNQWFREEFERRTQQPAAAEPRLEPVVVAERTMGLIERVAGFFDSLGGMDDRDQILLKDIARDQLLKLTNGSVQALAPADEELTISEAWLRVTGEHLPRKLMKKVGMAVARMYREEFQADPPKRVQFVDGAPRKVNSYQAGWLLNAVRIVWEDMRQKEAA